MRIWPVVLDSQPEYLAGSANSLSILLAPMGTSSLAERVFSDLTGITRNAPVVVAPSTANAEYDRSLQALSATARIMRAPEEFAAVIARCELSDAILFVDPTCLTLGDSELARLVGEYTAEPRAAHSLIALQAPEGGKEHVSFDNSGQVRGIQRFYDQTISHIAGISATMVPVSSGALGDGSLPTSLIELRQMLAGRGVPGRDLPVHGGVIDLSNEHGLLSANERFAQQSASEGKKVDGGGRPVFVGDGHSIHPDCRLVGPVVVQAGVRIDRNATILGPVVIGAGARIASGAIVAHATICAGAIVPSGAIVRDRLWLGDGVEFARPDDRPSLSYDERLARLSLEPQEAAHAVQQQSAGRRVQLFLKRAMDLTTAAIGLALLSPLLVVSGAAVWLESRGPIFFGDKREGLNGRVFRCWKFRTMFTGAHMAQIDLNALDHTDGPHFKCDRDPRVTRVGRVLRALNLDELPQLFNVLTGQMSLVGPRPSPFRENQVCVSWREARLSVRPGITGFWQVCRHDRSAGDFHQWIEYDLLYVQHLSLWLDLKILTATVLTLGGKASHIPAPWLVRSATAETMAIPESLPVADEEAA